QPPSGPVRKVEFQTTQYEGPLPPGEEMRTYAELIKDGPERIMAMAEREQAHRHRVQGFVVMSGFAAQVVGTATAALYWPTGSSRRGKTARRSYPCSCRSADCAASSYGA